MSRRYQEPDDPERLKQVAQRVAHDPEQPESIRQAARDIAAAAQAKIDEGRR